MIRRKSKGSVVNICLILLVIGFIYGYVANDKDNNKELSSNIINIGGKAINSEETNPKPVKQKNIKDVKQEEMEEPIKEQPIKEDELLTTSSMQIVFKTYYEKARDTIIKEREIPAVMIGSKLDDFKEYLVENYPKWDIRQFSKEKVELYQVSKNTPPNYYIIKEKDGYVAVFKVNENEEMVLMQKTEIPVVSLSETDLKYIEEGIERKDEEEINQILEDYSS
ncbi:BofC C-terminal domain-containing protein [Lutibacter sp. B2]|nr:BofC C-terminal domain-containing protein [Lutibacter sp. B2]